MSPPASTTTETRLDFHPAPHRSPCHSLPSSTSQTTIQYCHEVAEHRSLPQTCTDRQHARIRYAPCTGIPGVRGVGPKRATFLLRQHGTLEQLLRNIDSLDVCPIYASASSHVCACECARTHTPMNARHMQATCSTATDSGLDAESRIGATIADWLRFAAACDGACGAEVEYSHGPHRQATIKRRL